MGSTGTSPRPPPAEAPGVEPARSRPCEFDKLGGEVLGSGKDQA